MTEAQWLGCQSVYPMTSALASIVANPRLVSPLKGTAAERKFRLLACALARRAEPLMTDPRSRAAIEVAERFAAGAATKAELRAAFGAACAVVVPLRYGYPYEPPTAAETAARAAAQAAVQTVANHVVSAYFVYWPLSDLEMVALIRDVFGNPFRPVDAADFRPTAAAAAVAAAIYADRAFDRLPILADALEDGGCTDEAMLSHCREPGSHVRGCWVVDAALGNGAPMTYLRRESRGRRRRKLNWVI